jgi:hypothetical protein
VDGETQTIDMQKKRSGQIYQEIMRAMRAVDLGTDVAAAKEKAKPMAKPYLNWV